MICVVLLVLHVFSFLGIEIVLDYFLQKFEGHNFRKLSFSKWIQRLQVEALFSGPILLFRCHAAFLFISFISDLSNVFFLTKAISLGHLDQSNQFSFFLFLGVCLVFFLFPFHYLNKEREKSGYNLYMFKPCQHSKQVPELTQ